MIGSSFIGFFAGAYAAVKLGDLALKNNGGSRAKSRKGQNEKSCWLSRVAQRRLWNIRVLPASVRHDAAET
jgi:hypothetical protein